MASPSTPTSTLAAGADTTLKNAHVFEVISPLPIQSKKGIYLPVKFTPTNRRRRVSVEVHKLLPSFEADAADDTSPPSNSNGSLSASNLGETEICYVRVLYPPGSADAYVDPIARKLRDDAKKTAEKGIFNIFSGDNTQSEKYQSPRRKLIDNGDDGDDDDDDSSTETIERDDDGEQSFEGWYPKYKLPIRVVTIVERKKRTIEILYQYHGRSHHREFIFDSESAAIEFCAIVEKNKELQEGRAKARLHLALGGTTLKKDEKLTFLIDICSGNDLPRCDIGAESDPYVTVRFNGTRIHKTDWLSNNANPIWTLRKGSLFIWTVDAVELFSSEDGLIFEVKDYDAVGENESLGAFTVSPKTLYKWNGERRQFALKPLLGKVDYGKVS
jgi:hypothetical protein